MVKLKELPLWDDELDLLTACVVGEAEGESLLGKIAVACVIRNRVNDKRWPDNYKDVILQPNQFSCFSNKYYKPEIMQHRWSKLYWRECKFSAYGVYYNWVRDITNGANHYFATYIKTPSWAENKHPILRLGVHQFYRL